MADKWADYLISAVRYNAAETHIDQVRCHTDQGDSVGSPVNKARQTVVASIESGTTYATIYKDSNSSSWNRGADVRVVRIDGTNYIRTDADKTKMDNLGNLPRY